MNNRVRLSLHPLVSRAKIRAGLLAEIPDSQLGRLSALPAVLVIWRQDRAGLFSVLGTVLRSLEVAEWLGAIPVVDTNYFSTAYTRHGEHDLWGELFEPLGEISVSQLIDASERYRIFFTDGGHPEKVTVDPERLEVYRDYWLRYVRIRPNVGAEISERLSPLGISERTIGVHFRGGDMRTAPRHPLPPSLKQLIKRARSILDSGEMDSIYLATNVAGARLKMERIFGKRVLPAPSYFGIDRSEKSAPFSTSPKLVFKNGNFFGLPHREHNVASVNHAHNALMDMVALSQSGGLLCGDSNVSLFAQVVAESRHSFVEKIDNGMNFTSRVPARVSWYVRAALPPRFGGFK